MNNNSDVKCPRCKSKNVIIQNRGYSLLQGLILGIILVAINWIYTIIINIEEWYIMSDIGQSAFVFGLLVKGFFIFGFGLLLGLIGKNKLVARCLNCNHKFNPIKKEEYTPVKNYMITGSVSCPKLIETLNRYAEGRYWKITNPNTFEYKQSDPDSDYVFPDLDDSQNCQLKEFLQEIRLGKRDSEDLLRLLDLLTQIGNFTESISRCTQQ